MNKPYEPILKLDTHLLPPGEAPPRADCPSSPLPSPTPSLRSADRADRGIRTPTSSPPSSQPAAPEPLHQPQQRTLPRVPHQQPIDQPPAAPHHLARQLDHRGAERRELHPQPTPPLGPVRLGLLRLLRQQQG